LLFKVTSLPSYVIWKGDLEFSYKVFEVVPEYTQLTIWKELNLRSTTNLAYLMLTEENISL